MWHPSWPFKDSITGKSCQELADDYMAKTGDEWTAPIGQYGKFEWAVDVFKRVTNPDDKEEIVKMVSTTKLETCLGPMDFTAPVQMGTRHPVPNVYTPPVGGAQWVKGQKFDFEPVMVSNALSPELPTVGQSPAYGLRRVAFEPADFGERTETRAPRKRGSLLLSGYSVGNAGPARRRRRASRERSCHP